MSAVVEEISVHVFQKSLRLSCKLWSSSVHAPVENDLNNKANDPAPAPRPKTGRVGIACPGWLDNAGSFDTLAPLLIENGCFDQLLCYDAPGCGHSDHRPLSQVYNDFEEAPMLVELADALGYAEFYLLAHSRGGGVAALAAGAFPHRVRGFVCMESGFGLTGVWTKDLMDGAPKAAERMRMSYETLHRNYARTPRIFKTIDEAVDANAHSADFPKSRRTARNIVKRHLRPCNGGFTFTHDPRTYSMQQFLSITEKQTREFLEGIECPVLQILCQPTEGNPYRYGNAKTFQIVEDRRSRVSDLETKRLVGGHHLHSDIAEEVAVVIREFMVRRRMMRADDVSGDFARAESRL